MPSGLMTYALQLRLFTARISKVNEQNLNLKKSKIGCARCSKFYRVQSNPAEFNE